MVIEGSVDDHQRVQAAERPIELPRSADQLPGDRKQQRRFERFGVFDTNSQRAP